MTPGPRGREDKASPVTRQRAAAEEGRDAQLAPGPAPSQSRRRPQPTWGQKLRQEAPEEGRLATQRRSVFVPLCERHVLRGGATRVNETCENKTSHKTCLGRQHPNKEIRWRPSPVAQRLRIRLPGPGTRAQSRGWADFTAVQPPGLCTTPVEATLQSLCSPTRGAPQ